jgi:hypothetical protein
MLKTELNDNNGDRLGAAQSSLSHTESTMAQVVDVMERELQEIAVAMSVLQDISTPESTLYLGSVKMLDIEREFQARLKSAEGQSLLPVG